MVLDEQYILDRDWLWNIVDLNYDDVTLDYPKMRFLGENISLLDP
jgi:hypothetical protein